MTERVEYWIACSGGADSVALVHLMKEAGKSFGVLHCDFQLRGEDSDKDRDFVRNLADELKIPYREKKFDTLKYKKKNKQNTQQAARELRYEWFEEIARETNALICLGHHKDDQIETFLLQLKRGGKVNGLSTMPQFRECFVRPLLSYTKEELVQLCKVNNWAWREDKSNRSNQYKRNLYRNALIPLLKKNDLSCIYELTDHFKELRGRLEHLKLFSPNKYGAHEILIDNWSKLPKWIKHLLNSELSSGVFPLKEIEKLCNSKNGASFNSEGLTIVKDRDKIVFFDDLIDQDVKSIKKLSVNDGLTHQKGIYVDVAKIAGELKVRSWNKDDRIKPLGMKGTKFVSKFLKDQSVPSYARKLHKIVVDQNETVVAIVGGWINDNVALNVNTSEAYYIEC